MFTAVTSHAAAGVAEPGFMDFSAHRVPASRSLHLDLNCEFHHFITGSPVPDHRRFFGYPTNSRPKRRRNESQITPSRSRNLVDAPFLLFMLIVESSLFRALCGVPSSEMAPSDWPIVSKSSANKGGSGDTASTHRSRIWLSLHSNQFWASFLF